MGRGRKGILEQSGKKKATGAYGQRRGETAYLYGLKGETTKISVPELDLEFMKNMNPKELVDILLPNDGN